MNCFKFNSVLFLFVCLIRHTRTHIYLVVTTANIFFCIGYPIIKRWMVGNFSINRFHPPHLSTFSSQLLWNRHIYPPSQTSYCETATFIHLLKPATVFRMLYVLILLVFNELRWEIVVHFLGIGGWLCRHFLSFI